MKILSFDSTLMQWQEIIHRETGSVYNFCVNGPIVPKCKEFDQSPPKNTSTCQQTDTWQLKMAKNIEPNIRITVYF